MTRQLLALIWMCVAATGAAAKPACYDPKDAQDEMECLSAEMDKAGKKLADYLSAAKARIAADEIKGIKLDAAQAEWLRYRTAHCRDVYQYWIDGTYRDRASAQCVLDLTRARTRDIWSAYLTYVDSTPPLRPEP
ncbi:MAG TPA: lysozyme inhibitor LprI family protein [Telluria sp.]